MVLSVNSWSYTQSCELVAKMAGENYEVRPNWFASLSSPSIVSRGLSGTVVERNGAWYIYEKTVDQFQQSECAPQRLGLEGQKIEIVPVLYNRDLHRSAVINGRFVIKVYRVRHLNQLAERYGFNKVSVLPNRFTAIFNVLPQKSYDHMIERLDLDRDVEWVAPVLSEPN